MQVRARHKALVVVSGLAICVEEYAYISVAPRLVIPYRTCNETLLMLLKHVDLEHVLCYYYLVSKICPLLVPHCFPKPTPNGADRSNHGPPRGSLGANTLWVQGKE